MNGLEDDLMNSVLDILSEKVNVKSLQKANTQDIRKRLLKSFIGELFYTLLKEKRVDLAPGFGSLILKEIKEKDKKVFDKKSQTMVLKHIHGSKIVYIPGEVVKEFL